MKLIRLIAYFLIIVPPFAACQSSKKIETKKMMTEQQQIKLPDSIAKKQAEGIDYFAQGDVPVKWTLEMDIDKGYYFKSANGIIMNTPPKKAVSAENAATRVYVIYTTQGDMKIELTDEFCATITPNKKVTVTVNNTRYQGCGGDLYNAAINDTWLLEKNGVTTYSAKDFINGLPKLSFDITKGTMRGSDGCGNISSLVEMKGSRIRFFAISASKKGCKNDEIQKIFMSKLNNQVADYYFREGKLYLYLIDDSILIFRKAT